MPSYTRPGVYFEWLDTQVRAIGPARTDIAAFVGIAERGPVHCPIRLGSWDQFTSSFGEYLQYSYLAFAVDAFFANGGQTCWIVRVVDPTEGKATCAEITLPFQPGGSLYRVMASSPGIWGSRVAIDTTVTADNRYTLTVRMDGVVREVWRNLTDDPDDPRYPPKLLKAGFVNSQLIVIVDGKGTGETMPHTPVNLVGGSDLMGGILPEHMTGENDPKLGLATLELVEEVAIVAMPDIMPRPPEENAQVAAVKPDCRVLPETSEEAIESTDDGSGVTEHEDISRPPVFNFATISRMQRALIAHCVKMRNRVAVLDPLPEISTPGLMLGARAAGGQLAFDTGYAALYYPWLLVADPFEAPGAARAVPPSGAVAGIYARNDLQYGVHKSPANEIVNGIVDVADNVDDINHGLLNTAGVNVIRASGGRGIRVMGGRSVSSDLAVRYISVRRLMSMVEESISIQSQALVFEPNDTLLWGDVERLVGAFLRGLWQKGMLDGGAANDAYFVHCNADTNSPEDTDSGRLICEVGLQPPWPAEFVIVRIGITESGAQIQSVSRG